MSGIINKVKEALHSDHSTGTTHNTTTSGAPEGTHGPHGSRVANAADPRVDSDRDGSHNAGAARTAGHGEYGSSTGGYTHGTGPTHASHDTGLGATTGAGGYTAGSNTGTREGEHGPHSTRTANALDPRVDSDRDGSHNLGRTAGQGENYGSSTGGYAHGTGPTHASHTTGLGASTGSAGFGQHTSGTREGDYGPHSSRLANAADPRVDSDRDGSRNLGQGVNNSHGPGAAGYGSATHTGNNFGNQGLGTGHTGVAGTGVAGETFGSSTHTGAHTGTGNTFGSSTHTGTTGNTFGAGTTGYTAGSNTGTREGEHGPHSTRTANALDPRVDSDRDGSHNLGGNQGYGTHAGAQGFGTGHNTGAAGYGSNTGAAGYGSNTASGLGNTGPGPAPNTAGPHKSDMVNKLDPRVDSDLDGSKTVGGNKTYQSGAQESGIGHRDPTDAAQVPPSVLRQTLGDPTLEHGDHEHGRDRRNSAATHQERHSGV